MKISQQKKRTIKSMTNFNQTITHFLFTALLICVASQITFAAGERLDTSFNAGVSDAPTGVYISSIQSDGKILIGGNFQLVNGTQRSYLARLNSDGTIDTSFNNVGSGLNGSIFEIITSSDGKILIGGGFTAYNGIAISGLARLNSDGSLDTSFNSGGTGVTGTVLTIALQTNGKILISGSGLSAYNGTTRFSVIRVNVDGTLDTSFTTGFTSATFVEEVDVQTDGKILIGGSFSDYGGVARSGVARLNADGTLDTAFVPATTDASVAAMTIQPDGKILIGGGYFNSEGSAHPLIARLNTDGSADTTFTQPVLDGFGTEYFAVQPDGKILAAGGFASGGSTQIIALLRLNANGTIDNSFQSNVVDTSGYSVKLQTDGKIILTGDFSRYGNQKRNGIVRLNFDGNIDNSFNSSLTNYGFTNAIAQQSDGKIIVGGKFQSANGNFSDNVVRFNLDGTLDTSFSIGTGLGDIYYPYSGIQAISIQPDGKILISGAFRSFNEIPRGGLVRLNFNGSVDTSFNAAPELQANSSTTINDIFVQSDGKILIGGRFFLFPSGISNLARLNSDGSLDSTFNSGNRGPNSLIYKIIRQTDGKLIIAGGFSSYNGTSRSRIARINSDGTLDTSFNPGTGANSTVYDAAIQNDGKIIISGAFTTFNGISRNRIARLNADGSLDTSFDVGTGADSIVYSIALQSSGKIIIGGLFANYNGTAINRLAKLNSDGSSDTSLISGFDNNSSFYIKKLLYQTDGKLLVGGVFTSYAGVAQNSLLRLFIPESYSAPTMTGQNVSVSPTNNTNLNFSNVTTAGNTTVTVLSVEQVPPVPSGFSIFANNLVYDITTSAVFSGNITVTFQVPNVANASTCGNLRILHYENGAWTFAGNGTPNYNSSTQVCTLSQTVTSLSPFVIALMTNSSTASIAGTVIYGTTPAGQSAKFVPDVALNASGISQPAMSDTSGYYQLFGLTPGSSYTVTAAKSGGANGITSFDATSVLRYVAAGGGTLTANQIIAANANGSVDGNGNPTITSFDATQILRYVAAAGVTSQTGQVTNWKFLPPSRSYNSLTNSLSGENYQAVLVGDVNGSWQPPAAQQSANRYEEESEKQTNEQVNAQSALSFNQRVASSNGEYQTMTESSLAQAAGDLTVSLPSGVTASTNSIITIPVTLEANNGKTISGYSFAVNFDPAILQPENPPIDKTGTLSSNFTVISDTNTSGRLGVAAAGGNSTITGTGVLLNLRFRVVGTTGMTNLTFNQVLFEDDNGDPITTMTTNGSFVVTGTTAAGVNLSGRVSNSIGRGIQNVVITMTDSFGNSKIVRTTAFGYYHFNNVAAGETYIISAKAKRYTFVQPTLVINATQNLTEINFTAFP